MPDTTPTAGQYIAWNVPHVGTTVCRVTSHSDRYADFWMLLHRDGYEDGWDRLPRNWRHATEQEAAEFERIRNGRLAPVAYE